MAKKLWDKGLPIDDKIEAFTIGKDNEWDLRLAPYDVQGSIAHVKMLAKVGLLSQQECDTLVAELERILKEDIETGQFIINDGVEDIHSQIEFIQRPRPRPCAMRGGTKTNGRHATRLPKGRGLHVARP